MDMVITGRYVIFSFTTEHVEGKKNNIRKGLLIEDEKIVASLTEWFEDTWRNHSSLLNVNDSEVELLDKNFGTGEIEYFDEIEQRYYNYEPTLDNHGAIYGLQSRMWLDWKSSNLSI